MLGLRAGGQRLQSESGDHHGLVPNSDQSLIEFTSAIKEGGTFTIGGQKAGWTGATRAEVEGTTETIFIGL